MVAKDYTKLFLMNDDNSKEKYSIDQCNENSTLILSSKAINLEYKNEICQAIFLQNITPIVQHEQVKNHQDS